MSTDSPLFSVVIPAYNARKFISLTIESILRQTVQDFEIVVVNDGSTDDTLEVLQSISDPRLRIITRENGGECAARNQGFREARGKYVSFLDSDDVWLENHLEQAQKFMDAHPECEWFASTYTRVPDIRETDIAPADLSHDSAMLTNWYLEGYALHLPSSTTMRRSALHDYPHLFQEGYKMFGDALGWAKFAKAHPMIGIASTSTMLYRFWQGNACTTYNVCHHGERTEQVKNALSKHLEFYHEPDCPPEAKLYYRQFALGDWWSCITSALMPEEWREDFMQRRGLVGSCGTRWMKLWSKAADVALHAMRWGIRRRKLAILREMAKAADKVRTRYGNNLQ